LLPVPSTHADRATQQSLLAHAPAHTAEAKATPPPPAAEPAAVRHPDSLPCEARVKPVHGVVVKDRRPQAHATQGPGVGPHPFDEGVILAYPVCGEREPFGQSPAPFADDVIATLEDVQRQSLVQGGA